MEKTGRPKIKWWKKYHKTLRGKVVRYTMLGALLLGFVMLVIGLGLYIYSLVNQYITESFSLAQSASFILQDQYDLPAMSEEVMTVYRGMTEEERSQTGTEEYREKFKDLLLSERFEEIFFSLSDLLMSSEVNDLYIGCYDRETQALVYICDPDMSEETGCWPGDWEKLEKKELDKFLNWNLEGKLYDIGYTERYGWMCTSGMPVYTYDGKISCYVLADVTLRDVGRGIRLFVLQYTIAFILVVLLLSRVLSSKMERAVVEPINRIADAAKAYAEDRRNGAEPVSNFSDLDIKTGDEVENLGLVMADMEQSMARYEESLTRITAENERIATELSLATRIQADMLPNIFPPFPERTEFDIYATMDPAKEVGGDFYDFFLIDEDHLALEIADVSGKGIPAALFMMASKIILANNAMQGKSPAEILYSTNKAICSNNREEMFVTVWLGILEISTGKLTAANAGHEYPVLMQPSGSFELFKDKHGFVIGGMDGMKYKDYEIRLEPGAKLFVYTDGVPEATSEQNEQYGTDRMIETLNRNRTSTLVETLTAVRNSVDSFVGDAEQFDDLTMLCLEYSGPARPV